MITVKYYEVYEKDVVWYCNTDSDTVEYHMANFTNKEDAERFIGSDKKKFLREKFIDFCETLEDLDRYQAIKNLSVKQRDLLKV
jgi:hypothetical protein